MDQVVKNSKWTEGQNKNGEILTCLLYMAGGIVSPCGCGCFVFRFFETRDSGTIYKFIGQDNVWPNKLTRVDTNRI